MVVAAHIYHESNVLADAMDIDETVRIDVPCIEGMEGGIVKILCIASGPGVSEFEAKLQRDRTVSEYLTLNHFDSRAVYEIVYTGATLDNEIFHRGTELGAVFLSTHRTNDIPVPGGYLKMLFNDKETLRSFCDFCTDLDFDIEPHSIYQRSPEEIGLGLTPPQRDVLRAAHRLGYFEVPRNVTMAEIAQEVGVSQQAVSERMRRGLRHVVDAVVHDNLVDNPAWEL